MDIFVYFIAAAVVILFHALAVFLNGNISKITNYVNIVLHIGMFFGLMMLKAKLETLAISFMFSLFIYLLFSYMRYFFSSKRKREEDEGI